jgi:DNA mismatch endonuclease, patch repair protein
MDRLSPEQRHKNMANIRNRDSKIEIVLRTAVWNEGIRYRKNYAKLPGKPDIVITKYKIAIFCDSEFFHGKDWEVLKEQLARGNNSEFWQKKILRNIERDKKVNKQLQELGWKVLRFWGKDITKNLDLCIASIKAAISNSLVDNTTEE